MSFTNVVLSVEKLRRSFSAFLLEIELLQVYQSEYFVLLGPTGSGKSSLMEMICGLRTPDSGNIKVAGKDVTNLDPSKRQMGYVPQDYALLPFKSVRDNIAFGLQARKLKADEMLGRVNEMMDVLGITHLADRSPSGLSGGERQRVALARALVISPTTLLLDEPLSAIDEDLRESLLYEIRRIHEQLGTTTLHICHSLEEAFALGDRLGVMRDGKVMQVGTPDEISIKPSSAFVSRFLRIPNTWEGEIRQNGVGNAFYSGDICLTKTSCSAGPGIAVFPTDQIVLSHKKPAKSDQLLTFPTTIQPGLPQLIRPELRLKGPSTICIPGIFPGEKWRPGNKVYVSIPREKIHIAKED